MLPIHVYDKILPDLMNILIKILFVQTGGSSLFRASGNTRRLNDNQLISRLKYFQSISLYPLRFSISLHTYIIFSLIIFKRLNFNFKHSPIIEPFFIDSIVLDFVMSKKKCNFRLSSKKQISVEYKKFIEELQRRSGRD